MVNWSFAFLRTLRLRGSVEIREFEILYADSEVRTAHQAREAAIGIPRTQRLGDKLKILVYGFGLSEPLRQECGR